MRRGSRPTTASSIADGVLTGYILSSYSARKLGLQTTGNAGGAHNLLVAPTLAGGMRRNAARGSAPDCW